jgi:hypothetical protein
MGKIAKETYEIILQCHSDAGLCHLLDENFKCGSPIDCQSLCGLTHCFLFSLKNDMSYSKDLSKILKIELEKVSKMCGSNDNETCSKCSKSCKALIDEIDKIFELEIK